MQGPSTFRTVGLPDGGNQQFKVITVYEECFAPVIFPLKGYHTRDDAQVAMC